MIALGQKETLRFTDEGYIRILGRAKRFAKIGGEMVSLTAVEELALNAWPGHTHAAVNLPDEKKGEKILLITSKPDADRKDLVEFARNHGYSELYIPRRVVGIDEIPVLGTGKTDYTTLQQLAEQADTDNSSWIERIGSLVNRQRHN